MQKVKCIQLQYFKNTATNGSQFICPKRYTWICYHTGSLQFRPPSRALLRNTNNTLRFDLKTNINSSYSTQMRTTWFKTWSSVWFICNKDCCPASLDMCFFTASTSVMPDRTFAKIFGTQRRVEYGRTCTKIFGAEKNGRIC